MSDNCKHLEVVFGPCMNAAGAVIGSVGKWSCIACGLEFVPVASVSVDEITCALCDKTVKVIDGNDDPYRCRNCGNDNYEAAIIKERDAARAECERWEAAVIKFASIPSNVHTRSEKNRAVWAMDDGDLPALEAALGIEEKP